MNLHARWALLTALGVQLCIPARGAAQALYVEPDGLDFGDVMLLSSHSMTVRLENTGTANLIITSISSSTRFTWSGPTLPLTIVPGAFESLTVIYRPTVRQADASTIIIKSNATNLPYPHYYYLGVSGHGVAPKIAVSATSVGLRTYEDCYRVAELLIKNWGGNIPLVGNITMADGGSPGWTFSPSTFDIPLQASVPIRIEYHPTGVGVDNALLMITSNDPTQTQPYISVNLNGEGWESIGGACP